MPGFKLYTSNRLEVLSGELSHVLSSPLYSPFQSEIIVLQSKGMERWLSMELAGYHGICSNVKFLFPNAFVQWIQNIMYPDISCAKKFDPEIMMWAIMNILPESISKPEFHDLERYMETGDRELKLLQLSERIARTFDQYMVFRPETILGWENGEDNHWQAILWRELVRDNKQEHRTALVKKIIQDISNFPTDINSFPERISVFGISSLPAFHMELFNAISRFSEINLFLMNPCKEFWGDLLSGREIKRLERSNPTLDPCQYIQDGNSLLASMGTLGRNFFDMITEYDLQEKNLFSDPEDSDLLACIQSDILNLGERMTSGGDKKNTSNNDSSIMIHSCHSPMREMEVLYDSLLYMFDHIPDLKPSDIMVMTPDIETYAPFIHAVFDLPVDDDYRIPFSIADRSIRTENKCVEVFMNILDLFNSRFEVSRIISILDSVPVRGRFGFSDQDIDLILKWISDTRIRWGIDHRTKQDMGLPGFMDNTWKAGLDRLLLGYAMPGKGKKAYKGILPYDHIEGDSAIVLGRFLEFTGTLFSCSEMLGTRRTLEGWSETLPLLLKKILDSEGETGHEMQIIQKVLHELKNIQLYSGFDGTIQISVLKKYLKNRFEQMGYGFGFITGGVTFAAMLPMRSIPFKVICLLGMNTGSYPRHEKPFSFDLMAKNPKKGDRSRRNDDRYLFLEALLSARKCLYISYSGQSIQDNRSLPPSELVSELMDYIDTNYRMDGKEILDHIFFRHRLQPFSPEYFKPESRLFSYSKVNLKAAGNMSAFDRKIKVPFISGKLPEPDMHFKSIDIQSLSSFFCNPARYILNKRLGIYLEDGHDELEDTENFVFQGLNRYYSGQDLLEKRIHHEIRETDFDILKATGMLPHGVYGNCVFDSLKNDILQFSEKIDEYRTGRAFDPAMVDIEISGFRITGKIDSLYEKNLLSFRYAGIKPKDLIRTWINHLVLNTVNLPLYPRTSILMGTGKGNTLYKFDPVCDSRDILAELLDIYWTGLKMPVHFFPEISWNYADQVINKNRSEDVALIHSGIKWAEPDNDYGFKESRDPYNMLCFGETDPIDREFQDLSIKFFSHVIHNSTVV